MFNRSRKDEASELRLIPVKANLVLKVVLCVLLIIGLRIWHLGVIQHEKKTQEAFHPRRKSILEPALRGTIRDRFNEVLAANKLEYRLSIIYSQFRDIPISVVSIDDQGKKVRRPLRKEYISKLSKILSSILAVPADRIEDVIYSYGALNNAIPVVLKKNVSESQYYQLKALEKDWLGIQVQLWPKRYYPKGKVACDLVGYLGPISKEKYSALVSEIGALTEYVNGYESGFDPELPDGASSFLEAKARLLELQEKAYSINDSVGVIGAEAGFDEQLRGYCGKRSLFSDARGNSIRQLPGSTRPTSGKRVLLSISSQLQEYAEELLAQNEGERTDGKEKNLKMPIMRGGAVVAMEPKTGEVLALASYPRFDPNDFIRAKGAFFDAETPNEVIRWIESDSFLEKVWEQSTVLKRELFKKDFYEEETLLTWDKFLELLLPKESPLFKKLHGDLAISELISLQRDFFALYSAYPGMKLDALVSLDALNMWFQGLETTSEKLLYVDLSRLILWHEDFSDSLINVVGNLSIAQFRACSAQYRLQLQELQTEVRKVWEEKVFAKWRRENEKEFLKQKRREERASKQYAKPYLEYIDKEANRQFALVWDASFDIIASALSFDQKLPKNLVGPFLATFKGFSDYGFPLLLPYAGLQARQAEATGKDLLYTALKVYSPGFCRSLAYRQPAIQGSLFKIITAYAGLKQCYLEKKGKVAQHEFSLFTMTDKVFKSNGQTFVGYFASGKPIPQIYKGGRIPKSLARNIGPLDLLRAIETSSNPYFALLAAEYLKNPNDLLQAASDFGLGSASGIALPLESKGKLPQDVLENKTGLYSLAIGQHTLLTTPLQTANMLACLANGGTLLEPAITTMLVGKDPLFEEKKVKQNEVFAYRDTLGLVGIDFPLFVKTASNSSENSIELTSSPVVRSVFLPEEIRSTLLEALRRVMGRIKSVGSLQNQLVGKTSTAESQERIGLGCGRPTTIYNHTWFGGVSFEKAQEKPFVFESPELVVVVYLRYGSYGKEGAPIAAKMVQKWREIQAEHNII